MQLFLEYLQRSKPKPAYAWSPKRKAKTGLTTEEMNRRFADKEYAATLITEEAKTWRNERESYPGWLICPSEKRGQFRSTTNDAPLSKDALDKIEEKQRPRVLFELAWRFARQYQFASVCISEASVS